MVDQDTQAERQSHVSPGQLSRRQRNDLRYLPVPDLSTNGRVAELVEGT
jgi:hypothetical protein